MANYLLSLFEDSLAKLESLTTIPTVEKLLGEHSLKTQIAALEEVMDDPESHEGKALPKICEAAEAIVALVDSYNPTPGVALNAFELMQTALAIRTLHAQEQDPVARAHMEKRRKLRSILDEALKETGCDTTVDEIEQAFKPLPKIPHGLRSGYTGQRKFPADHPHSTTPCDCCDGQDDPPQPNASGLHPN